ncbi:MAG: TIGR02300 family protein [Pseudomonadota bacterium]
MPKEEWGTKRLCPTTGRRFYDLNKDPIVSPYTGEIVTLDTGRAGRTLVADKTATTAKANEESEELIENDDDVISDDSGDVDLGDDVLEDDDDDNVSLDDIADVASDDDET